MYGNPRLLTLCPVKNPFIQLGNLRTMFCWEGFRSFKTLSLKDREDKNNFFKVTQYSDCI